MKKERRELPLVALLLNAGQLDWLPKNPRQWTQTDIDRTAASIREDTDFLEEMSLAIDRFKRWAADNGIYIPEPGDEARLQEIMLEMDRCRAYL